MDNSLLLLFNFSSCRPEIRRIFKQYFSTLYSATGLMTMTIYTSNLRKHFDSSPSFFLALRSAGSPPSLSFCFSTKMWRNLSHHSKSTTFHIPNKTNEAIVPNTYDNTEWFHTFLALFFYFCLELFVFFRPIDKEPCETCKPVNCYDIHAVETWLNSSVVWYSTKSDLKRFHSRTLYGTC